eukprot:403331233
MNSNKSSPITKRQRSLKSVKLKTNQDSSFKETPMKQSLIGGARDKEVGFVLDKAEDHLRREDMFVDYAEREIDLDPNDDAKSESTNNRRMNDKLPPRGESYAQKQKKQLREGVKHMTRATLSEMEINKGDLLSLSGSKNASRLMQNMLREDQMEKVRKIEKYKQMEEDLAMKDELGKAERMIIDEKKWYKEVVQRIDIVPDDINYYEKLAVKPGFDFIYALINCEQSNLEYLRVNIPEMLYFNFNSYLIYSDSQSRVHIKQSPKSKEFLEMIEQKSNNIDIVKNWNEPATVLRKATNHPCYQTINLFNWKQSYEYIRNGPANKTMIQRYQKSFGDKLTLYRAVVHPEEMVNAKGSGKYNFCYAINNKVSFKQTVDENQKILDEFQKLQQQNEFGEGQGEVAVDAQAFKSPRKLNNRFENRYLVCPFEVGSFDVYTYTGKTMSVIEKEAYKIFNFMEKAFDMRLLNCVTDWIRDEKGLYWFIGLKSYKLREQNYEHKTTKPSAFERELLAINVNKKVKKAYLEYIPVGQQTQQPAGVQKTPKAKKTQKTSDIRNIQRFRPKMFQWRIIMIAHKLIDVDPKLIDSRGHPVYLQYKFGENVTKFQLSAQGQPVKYVFEKIKSQAAFSRNMPNIVAETEAMRDENNEEIEILNSNREMVRVVKINKSRVSYFYTYKKNDLSSFFNSCEIEFRVTLGQNWNNYVSCCKGNFMNFFSNLSFNRGSESHYTRNMMLFTEDLQGINLRMTMGLSLDNESDMSNLSENDLKSYLGLVYLPPENFFPNSIVLNPLPPQWVQMLRNEPNQVFVDIDPSKNAKKKLFHSDGRPYTKMDYYRLQKYGKVENKLLSTTVANRAAGLNDQNQNVTMSVSRIESSKRNQSAGSPNNRPKLSIPDQIKQIQEKKKFKKRAFVMPSSKAAFFKKNKLAQNLKGKLEEEKKAQEQNSENDQSKDEENQNDNLKQKIKFKDIFKEEGMYHSVSEATMRRSFTLLKSATRDQEKKFTQEEMQLLDYEERYNLSLFDQTAIKNIEIKNLKITNPHSKEVQRVIKEEKKDQERKRQQLDDLKLQAGLPPPGMKRGGKVQAPQKVFTREFKKTKKQIDEENQKKKEEEDKIKKEIEDRKFAELKTKLTHKYFRNVRSVNYANYSTL